MPTEDRARAPRPAKLPVRFVSHGSPMVALEEDSYTEALRRWSTNIPRPAAIVVVSAHWQTPRPVRVATSPAPATIHDFFGLIQP
jgi:4,5-DOPA dioxygenase extradiol